MGKSQQDEKYERIFFRLEKDKDGYPPDDWETLWAFEIESGLYSIDNVPFFVRGVSWKDVVAVNQKGDELHFKRVVRPSGHSVLRIIVFDKSKVDEVHTTLQQMGCDTEQSHIPGLLSVDCPPSIAIEPVLEFLTRGERDGNWEYEEASIRHKQVS